MTHRLTACLAITATLVARLPAAVAVTDLLHTVGVPALAMGLAAR